MSVIKQSDSVSLSISLEVVRDLHRGDLLTDGRTESKTAAACGIFYRY